jgi:hypothetical protein
MAARKAGAHIVVETVKVDWDAVPSAVEVALNPPKFPSFDTLSAAASRPSEAPRPGSED